MVDQGPAFKLTARGVAVRRDKEMTLTSTENGAPAVRNLKEMLQYQEKAVVSRMLLKNPAGNVTLFAFDGDEGLSEHTAPYDALVIAIEGRAEIPIGGVSHTMGEGDSLLLPANVPHAVNPMGGFKMLLIMIRGAGRQENA